eukprot:gene18367-23225_t
MVKSAPNTPFCVCSRATGKGGRKGPVDGENLEATVSGAHDSFVHHTQARGVRFDIDQRGPPASIKDDYVAAHLNRVGAIGGDGGGARRGDKGDCAWSEFGSGLAK